VCIDVRHFDRTLVVLHYDSYNADLNFKTTAFTIHSCNLDHLRGSFVEGLAFFSFVK